jgi:hypothetical protein
MRLCIVLVLLAFAAGHAHSEPAADDGTTQTGGKHYLALGMESVVLSTPSMTPDAVHPTTVEAGYRLGTTPVYAHAAVGATPAGFVEARGGIDLRAGTMVKGVFGIDAGYQHDPRAVDAMYSVDGAFVAPRLGLEVGTQKLWLRGAIDWRYTLAHGAAGHATSVGLAAGHDF